MLRQKPIYDRGYESFQKTIIPNAVTRGHIKTVRGQWDHSGYIGVHIRHGDKFPKGSKWKGESHLTVPRPSVRLCVFAGDYVPIHQFTTTAAETWQKLRASGQVPGQDKPSVYVATDSYAAFQDYRALSTAPEGVMALHEVGISKIKYMAHPHGYMQRMWDKSRPDERKRWTSGMIIDLAMMSGMWLQQGDRPPLAVLCTVS